MSLLQPGHLNQRLVPVVDRILLLLRHGVPDHIGKLYTLEIGFLRHVSSLLFASVVCSLSTRPGCLRDLLIQKISTPQIRIHQDSSSGAYPHRNERQSYSQPQGKSHSTPKRPQVNLIQYGDAANTSDHIPIKYIFGFALKAVLLGFAKDVFFKTHGSAA
jgi:hypothetical protein